MAATLRELLTANPDEVAFVLVEAVVVLRRNGLPVPADLAAAVQSHLASERLDPRAPAVGEGSPA